jgi:hypothetical protein
VLLILLFLVVDDVVALPYFVGHDVDDTLPYNNYNEALKS